KTRVPARPTRLCVLPSSVVKNILFLVKQLFNLFRHSLYVRLLLELEGVFAGAWISDVSDVEHLGGCALEEVEEGACRRFLLVGECFFQHDAGRKAFIDVRLGGL